MAPIELSDVGLKFAGDFFGDELRALAVAGEFDVVFGEGGLGGFGVAAQRMLRGFETIDLALDVDELDADFLHLFLRDNESLA